MLESRYPIGSGSGSVKGWHAAELAKFKAFDDREDNDHYIQNTKAGVTVTIKYDIGCKFCGHLAGYHGGEYKARVVTKECYRCWKQGHWDEVCAGYIKSECGDWFLKLLAKRRCIRLSNV
ncbi:hypothetical protein C1H46_039780 [Malus baccata]|uniref:CCHC-type domain-containing protein n=1 Tax=Malus baccata TaxID=106549 RepID=A0A540KKI7_MALBA|nr:hypothetical protein C1H46_039780 [Malus baccata]